MTIRRLEILFRLAEEGGVVLLPGRGFGTPHPSARVSLANLDEVDYARIGRIIRAIMQEYANEYQTAGTNFLELTQNDSSNINPLLVIPAKAQGCPGYESTACGCTPGATSVW
jgi:hypothetical protein